MKNTTITVLIIAVVGLGAYVLLKKPSQSALAPEQGAPIGTTTPGGGEVATTTEQDTGATVIGTSVEGRSITAYHYGTGATEILFVGDIHGGYTWNTALLAYETMDYLKAHPEVIPANLTVTVIPVLNPDGLSQVVGTSTANFTQADVTPGQAAQIAGRFNANDVDLNRNFDCDWKSSALWQGTKVSGGSEAFSEPESKAMKTYIESRMPAAVVAWYGAAGGVFASNCHKDVLPETFAITNLYAKAAGYKAYESYDFNAIPGDMVNWLAKQGIPAISVLLTNHTDVEWAKNEAGIKAILAHYAE